MPDGPPAADGLTKRQRMVLEYIAESVKDRGYPPSMREIGEAVGLASPSSVKHQLASLERKGFIRRDPNRPRAIEVRLPDAAETSGRPHRLRGPAAPRPRTSRSSDASQRVGRSWPSRPSKMCSRSPSRSSETVSCSC